MEFDTIPPAILRNNFDYFVEFIDPKYLINRLHAKKCLTDEERRYIRSLTSDQDKNDEIIKIISCNPVKYDDFVDALHEKKQYRVAKVADRGGAVMKASIVFVNQPNSADIRQKLYDRIEILLSKTSQFSMKVVQTVSLLARAGIEIVEARNSSVLSLWLWCRSEFALRRFDEMDKSPNEDLIKFFVELFTLLYLKEPIPQIISIDLYIPGGIELKPSGFMRWKILAAGQSSACAVTSHENNIYALLRDPTVMLSFAVDNPDIILEKTSLPYIEDPVDMVSFEGFVFISTKNKSCIWRISGNRYRQVQIKKVSDPYTMSVLHGCRILKVSHIGRSLEIYSPDLVQEEKIMLPSIINFALHAVGTLAKTFIVSYRDEGPFTGLCELNSRGDVLSVFDMRLQSVHGVGVSINQYLSGLIRSNAPTGNPEYLTVNERDEVFASDSEGGILVYNSCLMLEDTLEKDSIRRPSCIHYSASSNSLLVVFGEEKSEIVILNPLNPRPPMALL